MQAEYWHNPLDEEEYKEKNIFLPDLNNENVVNEQYKQRLMSLKKFVMVRFNQDTMVQPMESEVSCQSIASSDASEHAISCSVTCIPCVLCLLMFKCFNWLLSPNCLAFNINW